MRRSILFWCIVVVGIALLSSILIYVFTSGIIASKVGVPISSYEKCTITQVSISESDPGILLITVNWKGNYNSMNISFTDSIAKDFADKTAATLGPPIPNELPAHMEKTLQLNASKLAPGKYWLQLITSAGNCFISPSFTIS